MGWLDHSTNNIILDAVLTDYGRQQLAAANNSFNITYFGLGDDEVDYRMIKKYGRAVGKEKIEKNTPVFEAMTNPSLALKYRLIGRENDGTSISSVYLPFLKTNSQVALAKGTTAQVSIDLYFNNSTGTTNVPGELVQTSYQIRVPDRFFAVTNAVNGTLDTPDIARATVDVGDPNRMATYRFQCIGSPTNIQFTVSPKSIDNTALTIYGKRTDVANTRKILSYITVFGEQHGCLIDIPATYTATIV